MATPIVMPRLGDFMTEGVVTKFTKSAGDKVAQGEVVAEIETEKVNYDLEATETGLFHPVVEAGTAVAVDDVMGYLLAEGEAPPEDSVTDSEKKTPEKLRKERLASRAERRASGPAGIRAGSGTGPIPSTPGARKLALALGVDLNEVTSTGPRGRIVEADVRKVAEAGSKASGPLKPPGVPEPSEIVQFSGIRRAIANNMKDSLRDSAQLSFFFDVDVTEAQSLRRELGVGLTELLIKASAETLGRVPAMNSVVSGDSYFRFEQINIAMAVALDDGLIVPVIKDVGDKDLHAISDEVKSLSELARSGKIRPDQLVGGTFTISVLGSVDGFTPILNQGQVGLLGVGRSQQKPVVVKGDIVIREVMTISLTVDHQVIDGAIAANFCRRFEQFIERPSRL